MASIPGLKADVYFGDAQRPLPDWRMHAPEHESDDDDLSPGTIRAVCAMLGFDPREEDVDESIPTYADLLEAVKREKGEVWKGPSGRWFTVNQSGRVVPAKAPDQGEKSSKKAPVKKADKADPVAIRAHIDQMRKEGKASPEHARKLAESLMGLTVVQLGQLKKDLGLKASGVKAELAKKLAERALASAGVSKSEKKVPTKEPKAIEKPLEVETAAKPDVEKPGFEFGSWHIPDLSDLPERPSQRTIKSLENIWQANPTMTVADLAKVFSADEVYHKIQPNGKFTDPDDRANHAVLQVDAIVRSLGLPPIDRIRMTDSLESLRTNLAQLNTQTISANARKIGGEQSGEKPVPASAPKQDIGQQDSHRILQAILASKHGFLDVADLHDQTGIPLSQLHATIQDLRRQGILSGSGIEGRHGMDARVKAAAIKDPSGELIGSVSVRTDAEDRVRQMLAGRGEPVSPATKPDQSQPASPARKV